MRHQQRRVVITGMGAVTPIGLTVPTFWEALLSGTSGAGPITAFDTTGFETTIACELKGFDPLNYMDRKSVRRLDPFSHYALAAVAEAIQDAQLDVAAFTSAQRECTGVIFGSALGGVQTMQKQTAVYLNQGANRISPFCVPMMLTNMPGAQITLEHDLRGPSHSLVSACATGNHVIADAYHLIQREEADVVFCVCSEAAICELSVGAFGSLNALSTRNDSPATASRPFDATRDGFVIGEGAGVLVLEGVDHALHRDAQIYAEVIGSGETSDAHHVTAPLAAGQQRAMEQVLRRAGITHEEVDYINMHGTSTPMGDSVESEGIKNTFGEHAYRMNLSSTKSMIGHLFGAAGIVEAIATVLTIHHGKIPPTINLQNPDPACDLNYTPNTAVERPVHIALSNAFGFGGHSTSAGFRRWQE
jgi:3-oxoacyl-[acyl-carrier-protein] synthase II